MAEPFLISDFTDTKKGRGKVISMAMGAAQTKMPERICAKPAKLLPITAETRLSTKTAAIR